MKKTLLSVLSIVAFVSCLNAQTTYLDFEGATPNNSPFGGSSFSVVANPSKTGVNITDNVGMTQKAADGQTWGGITFNVGGTIDFAPTVQTFTMDVWCAVAGTAMFKIEGSPTQGVVENPVLYTTPGQWQTLTYTYTDRNPDYSRVVIFMGFNNVTTDVWYFDNVKGPDFTTGADINATFEITDLGGTATSVEVELSNDMGTKIPLDGIAGEGAKWTTTLTGVSGSTITAPITYTVYVNGTAVPTITNLDFVLAGSAPTTIAKNYGTAPFGVNLINNGTFDGIEGAMAGSTANKWGMYSGNGGTAEVISGVATIHPKLDAGANYNMQLEQKNFPLENDKSYSVSFDAWAAADRLIALTVEDPNNGYQQLGSSNDADTVTGGRSKWDIDITTEKTTYTRKFAVDKMLGNTVTKFAFLLAQSEDIVYIDNVVLKEISTVSVRDNKANAVKLYPNPAVNDLYISGKTAQSKVEIFNVVGKQVKEYSNVLQSVNVSGLNTGVYLIRLTDVNGKTVTSKFIKK